MLTLVAVAPVIAFAAPVCACSGPEAGHMIAVNELKTWALSGIAAILIGGSCVVNFVRRRMKQTGSTLIQSLSPMLLLVLCPPLWLSVRMGDCGNTAVIAGWAFVGLSGLALMWALLKPLARAAK